MNLCIDKFCSALFPEEKGSKLLSDSILSEVGKVTGLSQSVIENQNINFQYYKGLHKYLKNKQMRNEELPRDRDEMTDFIHRDNPPFIMKTQKMIYELIRKKMNMTEKEIRKIEEKKFASNLKRTKPVWKF